MRNGFPLLFVLLAACAPGGRSTADAPRALQASADTAQIQPRQADLLIDPIAELLEPIGLGFRVATQFAAADSAPVEQVSYGVDMLPLLIDVDEDLSTGVAGADIAVHVIALPIANVLEVRTLIGAPQPLPLSVEVEFSDPFMMLSGDGRERIFMGYDARTSTAPQRFREAVVIADLPEALLLGIQSASLDIVVEGGGEHLIARGGSFKGAARDDLLDISVDMTPPPATTRVNALVGNQVLEGEYELSTSEPSLFEIRIAKDDAVHGADIQQLLIDQIDGTMRLSMADTDGTELDFSAENRADYVEWHSQRGTRNVAARLSPLPTSLLACMASDEQCGSHGSGTSSSLSLQASEELLLNYEARNGDEYILIEDLIVQSLAVDFGARSSFRKGYVYFDTASLPFSGRVLQEDDDSGFKLFFGQDTVADQRLVTWKNYVQTDRRDGSMRCPNGASLDIKAGGRFLDADFVVDTLCQ